MIDFRCGTGLRRVGNGIDASSSFLITGRVDGMGRPDTGFIVSKIEERAIKEIFISILYRKVANNLNDVIIYLSISLIRPVIVINAM